LTEKQSKLKSQEERLDIHQIKGNIHQELGHQIDQDIQEIIHLKEEDLQGVVNEDQGQEKKEEDPIQDPDQEAFLDLEVIDMIEIEEIKTDTDHIQEEETDPDLQEEDILDQDQEVGIEMVEIDEEDDYLNTEFEWIILT